MAALECIDQKHVGINLEFLAENGIMFSDFSIFVTYSCFDFSLKEY